MSTVAWWLASVASNHRQSCLCGLVSITDNAEDPSDNNPGCWIRCRNSTLTLNFKQNLNACKNKAHFVYVQGEYQCKKHPQGLWMLTEITFWFLFIFVLSLLVLRSGILLLFLIALQLVHIYQKKFQPCLYKPLQKLFAILLYYHFITKYIVNLKFELAVLQMEEHLLLLIFG